MQEFQVNKFITLELGEKNTIIYVAGERFLHCKYLLINIQADDIQILEEMESIDEAAERLGITQEGEDLKEFGLSRETIFWAHCSNLQVWAENNYDTRLLHSNMAFPLLKKLAEVGDLTAIRIFKEEIVKRYNSGIRSVQKYLINEGYLEMLSKEELHSLIRSGSEVISELERIIPKDIKIDDLDCQGAQSIALENGEIESLLLRDCQLKEIPEVISKLESLKKLDLSRNLIETIPRWIEELQYLKHLDISYNNLEVVPNYISEFKTLNYLFLSNNNLKELPQSIGELRRIYRLEVRNNQLEGLPESIGNIRSIETLFVDGNKIKTLPESIGNIISLKQLILGDNLITSIPASIGKLRFLERINLQNNRIKQLPKNIEDLNNLRAVSLGGNNIDRKQETIINLKNRNVRIYF